MVSCKKTSRDVIAAFFAFATLCNVALAYEVVNHSDMTASALDRSSLATDVGPKGKLFSLGLKQVVVKDLVQVFPRAANTALAGEDSVNCWPIVGGVRQTPVDFNKLTLAEVFRYGACYEDNVDVPNGVRPFAHFYDPQQGGVGLRVASMSPFPASPDWTLNRSDSGRTGPNHYSYADARDYFYAAVRSPTKTERDKYWGLTFQALGHVVHHLQDMAQPQHVRSDDHCDNKACGAFGAYKPSGYEKLMSSKSFVPVIQALAETATAPVMFGLPREFWNATGSERVTDYAGQGIAAYTSTHYVSTGTDFRMVNGAPQSAPGFSAPRPTSAPSEIIGIGGLLGYWAGNAPQRLLLACPDLDKCLVTFWGSTDQPYFRLSSRSVFGRDLGTIPPNVAAAQQQFTQNAFTYATAAIDLVPRAVSYSAGLINYFFRGEMVFRPNQSSGMYGLIDGGNSASNCKDNCGFPKIKMEVKNTTPPINGVDQDMGNGTMVAVAKFSRNNCYTSDWLGDPGELNSTTQTSASCLLGGGTQPIEEAVVSLPVAVPALLAGSSQEMIFDFSANPIPVNAWNIKLPVLFRGQLGGETDAVAVATQSISAPSVIRILVERDYISFNRRMYTFPQANLNSTLLASVWPPNCLETVSINPLIQRLDQSSCYPASVQYTNWRDSNGTVLASIDALPSGRHVTLLSLGNPQDKVSGTVRTGRGDYAVSEFYPREHRWSEVTNTWFGAPLQSYRGLHLTNWVTNYYAADGRDFSGVPDSELRTRPAFTNPTPVQWDAINF